MLKEFDNYSDKFKIKISPDMPANTYATFILRYKASGYSDYQWTDSVLLNPSFQTQSAGRVQLTISGNGSLGYDDWYKNTLGSGFRYNSGSNLLFEGGFMMGTSSSHISDAVRGTTDKDTDFCSINPFKLKVPGSRADQQGYGSFTDSRAGDKKLGIETHVSSYSWNAQPYDKFIILKYSLVNKSGSDIKGLYAGLYLDWNLSSGGGEQADYTAFSEKGNFGYAYYKDQTYSVSTGCALLSEGKAGFYAIENGGRDGGIGVYAGSGGFTNEEKWTALTGGNKKTVVENGDVSTVTSAGPFDIPASDSVEVAFAIAAADDAEGLEAAVSSAREKYKLCMTAVEEGKRNSPSEYCLNQNYPNPFNPSTAIKYSIPEEAHVSLVVFDMLGRRVRELVNSRQQAGQYTVHLDGSELPSGVYICRMQSGSFVSTKKLVLLK
jgi:hypothetical protein